MMLRAHSLLQLGVLVAAAAAHMVLDECLRGNKKYAMNVVLLEDDTYEWSRPFVQAAVERAIEEDRRENDRFGTDSKATHRRAKTDHGRPRWEKCLLVDGLKCACRSVS